MVHTTYEDIEIPVSELEIGMQVVALDRPWSESPFLLQGFVIQSPVELDELRQCCRTVTIQVRLEQAEAVKQKIAHRKHRAQEPELPPSMRGPQSTTRVKYLNQVSFEAAVEASQMTFDSARSLAKNVLEGLRLGHALNLDECREVVDEVVSSVLQHEDALRFLTLIKNKDSYTAEHSMNVCVLAAAFARHLGLKAFEIHQIALCGLLHDVGKSRVPLDILNKPGRFTKEEAHIMAEHTTYGRNILMSASTENLFTVDVAHSHHERIDGKGYPRSLRESQISYYARIIAIVDAYDAMTSERVYGTVKSSQQALREILKSRGTHFDHALATEFVRSMGVYQAGALVEMASGPLAIVIRPNKSDYQRPRVLLVTDVHQQKLPAEQERVLDLALDSSARWSIRQEVPNRTAGIDVGFYIEKGLNLQA
ncbi:MAG: HD-GYP domain-containing protein [Saccharospirillum sp.]